MENLATLKNLIRDGVEVKIPNGLYNVGYDQTEKEFAFVSNNDASVKNILFNLKGVKNVTLDFCGSTIVLDGRIIPFFINGSKNVKIKNLNVKYSRRYYFQAEILENEGRRIYLKPTGTESFAVKDGRIILDYGDETLDYNETVFIQEFESAPIRVARSSGIRITTLGNLKIKTEAYTFGYEDALYLDSNVDMPFKKGNVLCFFCEKRLADVFVISESKNVSLENVNIYSSPAMGVIAQSSKNIELSNVNVIRDDSDPYVITTLADATHFTNCRGKVVIKNCTFENMNDDGTNIHGMYTQVIGIEGKNVDVKFKHFQQCGIPIYSKGDKVAFSKSGVGIKEKACRIDGVEYLSEEITRLKLSDTDGISVGGIIENVSAMPKVKISGCNTGGNRPRGFLIATNKKAVVENCSFYNSECGVGVFADTDFWFEAGAVKNLIIKNCVFKNSYGGGNSAVTISPSVTKTEKFFDKKITVKNNVFYCDYGLAVFASNVKFLLIKNNVAIKDGKKIEFNEQVQIKDCGGLKIL